MTLRKAYMRNVTVRRRAARGVYSPDERPTFKVEGVSIRAVIQPLSGRLEAAVYGERVVEMLLMLTSSRAELCEGMGVCVNGRGGACDYRIAAPPRVCHGHTRAVLERL